RSPTRRPFTYVPFVEPRSRMKYCPSRHSRTAWALEILRSGIAISWSLPRPIERLSGPSWTTRSPYVRERMISLGVPITSGVLARLLDLLLESLDAPGAGEVRPEAAH